MPHEPASVSIVQECEASQRRRLRWLTDATFASKYYTGPRPVLTQTNPHAGRVHLAGSLGQRAITVLPHTWK